MSEGAPRSKLTRFLNALQDLLQKVSMGKYFTKLYHRGNKSSHATVVSGLITIILFIVIFTMSI